MSGRDTERSPAGGLNPFSPTAIARVAAPDGDMVSIPTPAILEATNILEHYLAAQNDNQATATDSGNVIAIVGEHGTGKTHLVDQLLRHANEAAQGPAGAPTRTLYLDAPAATFVTLYRQFVQELDLADIRDRVREYCTDILIDALSTSKLTADVVKGLRDGELDPMETIERLSLMESSFLQQVQGKLGNITKNQEFGTALTLLLRRGFDDAVWEWLSGHKPDQILVDRGITAAIDTETAALEATGVFALLYGHRNHRFIVAIDELDRILLASSRSDNTAITAFKKLLEVFASARALLILAGLPDYRDLLDKNTLERIGRIIELSGLTPENTIDFIVKTQQRAFGTPRLAPFTTDTVRHLVRLTDGTARKIVRLCHQLYRKAIDEETEVTHAMVRQAVRTQSNLPSIETVTSEVRQVLEGQGLRYFRNHMLGPDPHSRAEYWVPVGEESSGCAILLTESVLDLADSDSLARRALSIRNSAPDADTVLVVVGYLPSDMAAVLSESFPIEPLVYDYWTFEETLTAIVMARTRILEQQTSDDPSAVVRQRLERMNRQQMNTQKLIERLSERLDNWGSSADRQFTTIRSELGEISTTFSARDSLQPADSDSRTASPRHLPPEVDRLFEQAVTALGAFNRVDIVLHQSFAVEDEPPAVIDPRTQLRGRLWSKDLFQAMGVAALLQKLITVFRDNIEGWYRSCSLDDRGQLRATDQNRLSTLCQAYDALYEYLPVFQLDKLEQFSTSAESRDDPAGRVFRPSRTVHPQEVLSGLGARIQSEIIKTFSKVRSSGSDRRD